MKPIRQAGFTLWELLVALLVAGVLFGLGVPNIMEFQRNGMMSSTANELVTALLAARSEAIKRQSFVTWCMSDNPTDANPTCNPGPVGNSATRGFIVWVDENGNVDGNGAPILTDASDGNAVVDPGEPIVRQSPGPTGTMLVSANCGYLSIGPGGFPRTVGALCPAAATATRAILYCDDRGRRASSGLLSSARVVRIEATGRGQVLQETAAVDAALGAQLAAVAPVCP
jgi:prepilin-type N-terminal cleavage/methylation domain-containing protein